MQGSLLSGAVSGSSSFLTRWSMLLSVRRLDSDDGPGQSASMIISRGTFCPSCATSSLMSAFERLLFHSESLISVLPRRTLKPPRQVIFIRDASFLGEYFLSSSSQYSVQMAAERAVLASSLTPAALSR